MSVAPRPHWRHVITLSCALFCVNAHAADKWAGVDRLLGVQWMGVYMQGKKAGYAKVVGEKTSFRGQPTYRFVMDMTVRVNMLGTAQEMRICEEKQFGYDGKLRYVKATMSSSVGGVTITRTQTVGVAQGDKMQLTIQSAGSTTRQTIDAPKETLADYLAGERLAMKGSKVGDSVEAAVFDGSLRRTLTAKITVTAKKRIPFNGVEMDVTVLDTFLREMNLHSTSIYDGQGKMLKTQMAGMFELRAEPEALAKNVTAAFDLIQMNVIRVKPIERPKQVRSMTVALSGVKNPHVILPGPRQTYEKLGPERYRLTTRVEDVSHLPRTTIPVKGPAFAADLAATPLLQCDDPRLKAKAKEIVGSTREAWAAAQKIRSFVFHNVRKVGAAALSNALETLETMRGDCTEHTALYVGLCRAAGIPARPCTGLVYWPAGGGFGYHQWAKVYVGKWVEVDPTFNEPVADGTHIKLAEGDLAEAAALVSIIGSLKIQVEKVEW